MKPIGDRSMHAYTPVKLIILGFAMSFVYNAKFFMNIAMNSPYCFPAGHVHVVQDQKKCYGYTHVVG